jgi:hypothetical protein
MKHFLSAAVTAVLLAGSLTAIAQTQDQSAQAATTAAQPTAAQANQKDPADMSKGQDLVNPKPTDTNPMKSPPTVGHDKAAGNNLVGADNNGQMMMQKGNRPDFKTIDTQNHGYVLASDVNNPWLKENFSKCDTNGDGKVTKGEYAICMNH